MILPDVASEHCPVPSGLIIQPGAVNRTAPQADHEVH